MRFPDFDDFPHPPFIRVQNLTGEWKCIIIDHGEQA